MEEKARKAVTLMWYANITSGSGSHWAPKAAVAPLPTPVTVAPETMNSAQMSQDPPLPVSSTPVLWFRRRAGRRDRRRVGPTCGQGRQPRTPHSSKRCWRQSRPAARGGGQQPARPGAGRQGVHLHGQLRLSGRPGNQSYDTRAVRSGCRTGTPRSFDKGASKGRSVLERCFNRLKRWRGIATRSDGTARRHLAGVTLASALIWIESGI